MPLETKLITCNVSHNRLTANHLKLIACTNNFKLIVNQVRTLDKTRAIEQQMLRWKEKTARNFGGSVFDMRF